MDRVSPTSFPTTPLLPLLPLLPLPLICRLFQHISVRIHKYRAPLDANLLSWPVFVITRHILHLGQHVKPADHPTQDAVLAIQMLGRLVRDKKLASVRVLARIRHRHNPPPVVPQPRMDLVLKRAKDVGTTGPRPRRVTTLDHKVSDAAVEGHAVVVAGGGQGQEILARLWREVTVQLQVQVTQRGMQADIALATRLGPEVHPLLCPLVGQREVHGRRRERLGRPTHGDIGVSELGRVGLGQRLATELFRRIHARLVVVRVPGDRAGLERDRLVPFPHRL